MNSLTELNAVGASVLEVDDTRPATVLFDKDTRYADLDTSVSYSGLTNTFAPSINIEEIRNYATANARFRISVVTGGPEPRPGSTLDFGTLPSGVTLSQSDNVYTISGIKSSLQWDLVKEFVWTFPANYATASLLYIKAEILYYDAATSSEKIVDWFYYDEDHFYLAYLQLTAQTEATAYRIKDFTIDPITITSSIGPIVNRGVLMPATDLPVSISLSAEGDVTSIVNLTPSFGISCSNDRIRTFSKDLTMTSELFMFEVLEFTVEIVRTNPSSLTQNYWNTAFLDTIHPGSSIPMKIDWGDGSPITTTNIGDDLAHIWPIYNIAPYKKEYKIKVWSTDKNAYFNFRKYTQAEISAGMYTTSAELRWAKILQVHNWGPLPPKDHSDWDVSRHQPFTCGNIYLKKIPHYEPTSNGYEMFRNVYGTLNPTVFNNLQYWYQTSPGLKNGEYMFETEGQANCEFNVNIGNWYTNNLTNARSMFENCNKFNQSLNNWNTSNLQNMHGMFMCDPSLNSVYNQPMNNWNTGNVYTMNSVFNGAKSFNQNISNWNTSNVGIMNGMFDGASAFNQDLSSWCVTLIPSKPNGFDTNTTAWVKTNRQPIWGTCP